MGSPLTTHILDTARGRPAAGVPIVCDKWVDGAFVEAARGTTNEDGRVVGLLAEGALHAGIWRMNFDTAAYFAQTGTAAFYPIVRIVFEVTEPEQHHHVPLLLSPFGYSTYRGS
jgi:5-hydroxyisourate hydrolase